MQEILEKNDKKLYFNNKTKLNARNFRNKW